MNPLETDTTKGGDGCGSNENKKSHFEQPQPLNNLVISHDDVTAVLAGYGRDGTTVPSRFFTRAIDVLLMIFYYPFVVVEVSPPGAPSEQRTPTHGTDGRAQTRTCLMHPPFVSPALHDRSCTHTGQQRREDNKQEFSRTGGSAKVKTIMLWYEKRKEY